MLFWISCSRLINADIVHLEPAGKLRVAGIAAVVAADGQVE